MTRAELARHLAVSPSTIDRWWKSGWMDPPIGGGQQGAATDFDAVAQSQAVNIKRMLGEGRSAAFIGRAMRAGRSTAGGRHLSEVDAIRAVREQLEGAEARLASETARAEAPTWRSSGERLVELYQVASARAKAEGKVVRWGEWMDSAKILHEDLYRGYLAEQRVLADEAAGGMRLSEGEATK